jgi:pimeloyl-ACP methyl ester carboxylesterase
VILHTRQWGPNNPHSVVCMHGLTQNGAIFEELGQRLATQGHSVIAVDLRGHGDSGREPPWNADTQVEDVLETLDAQGVERATWIGHSFGGRLAAMLASREPDRTEALALLDPGLVVDPDVALSSAETERLDWSFATADGAVNALLSNDLMVAPPHDVVRAFVEKDLQKGPDGRYRFQFSPSAVVVAWSELTLPLPPIARAPTLLLLGTVSLTHSIHQDQYREALGDLLTEVVVPNGHNVLWEAPAETIGAIEEFLSRLPQSVG